MNADNAARARMGKLKKEAESLGIPFQDDISEDTLKAAIALRKEELAAMEESKAAVSTKSGSVDESMSKFADAISSALVKGQIEAARLQKDGYEDTTHEVDPEDLGEVKIYYAPCIFWVLPPKTVAGRKVRAPYRKIEFKMDRGSAVQVGTQWQTKYTSIFATDNVKEQAYMETHPKFNQMFFLSHKGAEVTTEQTKFAQSFGRHIDALRSVQHNELNTRAAKLGIAVSHDMSLHTMRTLIAERMAKDEIETEKLSIQRAVDEDKRLALLKQST